jgi:hypothetical protein
MASYKTLLAFSLLGALFFLGAHGGRETSDEKADDVNPAFNGITQDLPQPPVPTGEKPGKESVTKPPPQRMKVSSFSLFIFLDGPIEKNNAIDSQFLSQSESLKETIRKNIPGAKILSVDPVTLGGIETVFESASAHDAFAGAFPSSVLVIVNAVADRSATGEYRLQLEGAKVNVQKLGASFIKLSQSIARFIGDQSSSKFKLEFVWLTSHAGALDCSRFPGPIFGITADDETRDGIRLKQWISEQQNRPEDLFPVTAAEWHDSFCPPHHFRAFCYFLCPYPNAQGYLGHKLHSDQQDFFKR